MTITGIAGAIGTGKSLKQLSFALEQCDMKKKFLVTNFAVNIAEIRKYAAIKKFHWVAWLCDTGQITIIDGVESLADIVAFKESVCCLDEAGIFLNSRDFQKTPKKLLLDLCQSRKDGTDLIWAAQFDTQVDRQFRQLTQWWIHAASASTYDRTMRRPKLFWKCYFYFDACSYDAWVENVKARSSFIRTYFQHAYKTDMGFIDKADIQLFKCFDSFARLEQQGSFASHGRSRKFSMLPPDYYFNKLGSDWKPLECPLRGHCRPLKITPIKPTLLDFIKGEG